MPKHIEISPKTNIPLQAALVRTARRAETISPDLVLHERRVNDAAYA
ncbi:MAG TPA: hypothetical protein VGX96_13155 [Candidatus Elarobacter sp.]|jgi:hypothetical protein|nr:hypothetical protein [Candidatus Elarobacter sp.]